MTLRTISYGGGVQSTALGVLAALGKIDFDTLLFSNVGDDSEHPATLDYVRGVAFPYFRDHGLRCEELRRVKRDGSEETLWGRLMKDGSRSLPIPVRMSNGAPGNRSCTADFKIKVIGKWLKANGASEDNPATVAIGISTDEVERAGRGRNEPYEFRVYPLLDLGLDRSACQRVIADAGLPVPPKSACFFCPFHRPSEWQRLAIEEPELFSASVKLERTLNERREMLGKDPVWLTRFNKPLDEVIDDNQQTLFNSTGSDIGEAGCDEGVCFV